MISPTEIANSLSIDRSKANIDKWVAQIETDNLDFNQFLLEVENQKLPTKWYMTWLLTHYIEANPIEDSGIQANIWTLLKTTTNQSILRDLWRCMSHLNVNENISGEVYESAIKTFTSQKQAIAIRAHALECACIIAKPFPELHEELKILMRTLLNYEIAGMRSKAKNWIKIFGG